MLSVLGLELASKHKFYLRESRFKVWFICAMHDLSAIQIKILIYELGNFMARGFVIYGGLVP